MTELYPVYSHNPFEADSFPLLVLNVRRHVCQPFNEGFRMLHWHNEVQFIYVLKGIVHAEIYEHKIDIPAGNCLFINQNAVHLITEKEDCIYHSFIIPEQMLTFFSGSIMETKDVFSVTRNISFSHYVISKDITEHQQILEQLRTLDALYFSQKKETRFEYRISLLLTSLWLEFIEQLPSLPSQMPSKDYKRLQELLSYIHANYGNDISLEDIARSANISKTECVRCFRKFTEDSPYQYLMKYRLHISTSLLENTDASVTEISMKTGFASPSSYISLFKKHYGCTPGKYKLLHKSS